MKLIQLRRTDDSSTVASAQALSAMHQIRLVLNHPKLLNEQYATRKNVAEGDETDNHTLVQQWRAAVVEEHGEALSELEVGPKIMILLQICKLAKSLKDKVLVFSFSLPTIELITEVLKAADLGPLHKITGTSGSASERVQDVNNFNGLKGYAVCVISTKAGGLGLNIASANRVVLFDHEWSPVHHEQAIGRAYRLGQKKPVFIYKLQIDNSFEIKLFEQSLTKQGLTSKVVDKKNVQTKLTHERLMEYFALALEKDRENEDFGLITDGLLSRVLAENRDTVISVQTTESFHCDEENLIEAADLIEIQQNSAAYQRNVEARRAAMEHRAQIEEQAENAGVNPSMPNARPTASGTAPRETIHNLKQQIADVRTSRKSLEESLQQLDSSDQSAESAFSRMQLESQINQARREERRLRELYEATKVQPAAVAGVNQPALAVQPTTTSATVPLEQSAPKLPATTPKAAPLTNQDKIKRQLTRCREDIKQSNTELRRINAASGPDDFPMEGINILEKIGDFKQEEARLMRLLQKYNNKTTNEQPKV